MRTGCGGAGMAIHYLVENSGNLGVVIRSDSSL